ncbi:MAG: heavy metal-associated domain-containing protein [Oscillospiraceae bacterium]|nr:heavy-metal-associated domain-containing protein [Oscillospiraceae bacterium]MDD7354197.1 heavy metal-associated domain-containing protein [Oscillospiraceae bacterium]
MVQTVIKINGMACSMCENHIQDAVRNNFKVKRVSASHSKGECVVVSEDELDTEKLKKVITDMGYDFISASSSEYVKHGLFSRKK